ncbi:hypothetical protein ARMGADRAFT_1091473 [Armillaria gallica]|uniref:Uncharacterized protein n=1 Tax=Armillaria gallica TaxID=47427 RepID=A0A2H3CWM3_ARMGA|nr:hypothetical protein ARMGADRAFT_1091473 [Armillaria gallica]
MSAVPAAVYNKSAPTPVFGIQALRVRVTVQTFRITLKDGGWLTYLVSVGSSSTHFRSHPSLYHVLLNAPRSALPPTELCADTTYRVPARWTSDHSLTHYVFLNASFNIPLFDNLRLATHTHGRRLELKSCAEATYLVPAGKGGDRLGRHFGLLKNPALLRRLSLYQDHRYHDVPGHGIKFAARRRIAFRRARVESLEPALGWIVQAVVLGSSPATFRSPRPPLSPFAWPRNQVLLRDDVLPSGEGRQIVGEGAWRIQVRRAVFFAEVFHSSSMGIPPPRPRPSRWDLRRNPGLRQHDVASSREQGRDDDPQITQDPPLSARQDMSALGLQRTVPSLCGGLCPMALLKAGGGLGDMRSAWEYCAWPSRQGIDQWTPLFTPAEPVAGD